MKTLKNLVVIATMLLSTITFGQENGKNLINTHFDRMLVKDKLTGESKASQIKGFTSIDMDKGMVLLAVGEEYILYDAIYNTSQTYDLSNGDKCNTFNMVRLEDKSRATYTSCSNGNIVIEDDKVEKLFYKK